MASKVPDSCNASQKKLLHRMATFCELNADRCQLLNDSVSTHAWMYLSEELKIIANKGPQQLEDRIKTVQRMVSELEKADKGD